MGLDSLSSSQRFMYEYGCFVAFWSNFELLMEAAIGGLTKRPPKENCAAINHLTAGLKKTELAKLLLAAGQHQESAALDTVFEIAERNDWIHGHILNPNGDFSRLTRLRVKKGAEAIAVTNSVVSFDASPFAQFYDAYEHCMQVLGLTKADCDDYIMQLQT